MRYKTLMIGAITLGALSIANASPNGVENSQIVSLESSPSDKGNPNGPENARYGKVEFKNLTPDTDYIIEPDNKKSQFGAFLIRNPITVKPGETADLNFEMDYGENASVEVEGGVRCESDGSASAGGATLFIGSAASGHYSVKASCEAVATLMQKAYLGLVARSHPIAKVSAVIHDPQRPDCVGKLRGGYISINPISYSVAEAHQHLDTMPYDDSYVIWEGQTQKGYVTNNNFEPGALEVSTVNVYSPSWEKTRIKRCFGE